MPDLDLKDIIKLLNDFQVVRCNLVHEKVLMSQGMPRVKEIGSDKKFDLKGLCPSLIRDKRLGCAHTMANSQFTRLIRKAELINPVIKSDIILLENLIFEIYQIDHLKGDLEKEKAIFCLQNDYLGIKKCEDNLVELIDKHQSLISDLDRLKNRIIQALKR